MVGDMNQHARSSFRQSVLTLFALLFLVRPVLSQTPAAGPQDAPFRNSIGMTFRKVKGTAVMFSIWETRVSDWKSWLAANGRVWTQWPAFPQDETHPVVNVTLQEALEFCEWLTGREHASGSLKKTWRYRLPTNAEWDVAAGLLRADDVRSASVSAGQMRFLWGNDWPPPADAGNFNRERMADAEDDGFTFTAPVGKFRATEDGLFDLAGNAWEWTCDDVSTLSAGGTVRGGSWMYWRAECLESRYQMRFGSDMRAPSIGFRCVIEDSDSDARRARETRAADDQAVARLLDRPAVSRDEVAKMAESLAARHAGTDGSNATSLHARKERLVPGQPFVNSLEVKLIPLGDGKAMLAEQEVRVSDYKAWCLANRSTPERDMNYASGDEHPLANVTWMEAWQFCRWLTRRERSLGIIPDSATYRMPTRSEWMLAAGVGDGAYSWGASWPPPAGMANIARVRGGTAKVQSLPADKKGFFDLIGNVAEWCGDGPDATLMDRFICGGSWQTAESGDLTRRRAPATAAMPDVGFRLVLEIAGGKH